MDDARKPVENPLDNPADMSAGRPLSNPLGETLHYLKLGGAFLLQICDEWHLGDITAEHAEHLDVYIVTAGACVMERGEQRMRKPGPVILFLSPRVRGISCAAILKPMPKTCSLPSP